MSNKIQIKRGSKAPGNGVLDVGELGYDTVDKAFYIGNGKDSNGTNLAPTKFKPSEINLSEYEVATDGKYLYPFFGLNTSGYQTTHTGKNLYLYCGPNYSYLSIGNSTHFGAITLHKGNSWYTNIVPNDFLTSNIKITLPSEGGTLLTANNLTKTIVTNALGYTPPSSDTNTTYTFTSGDSNGQIKVSPSSGSAYNVSVKGLGSAAYTSSTAYLPINAAAASANKVNSSLTIKLNGGSVEGSNLFTFNGSGAKSINITPSSIGAIAENKIRQELWAGSWSSKDQTIPNSDKYSIFLICLDGVGTPIIAAKYDNYIRGIGGHRLDSGNLIMYQFTGTFSGTTWTMDSCTSVTHTSTGHGDHSNRIVKRVYGVL